MKILLMALFVTTLFGVASVQAADTLMTVKGVKGTSQTSASAAPKDQIEMKSGETRTFIVDPEIMRRLDQLQDQLGELDEKFSSMSRHLGGVERRLTQPGPSSSLPAIVVVEEEGRGWFESVVATIVHWWHSFWEWLGEHWQPLLVILFVVVLIALLVRLTVWLRRPRKKFGPRREP